jgi:hypothetical protein
MKLGMSLLLDTNKILEMPSPTENNPDEFLNPTTWTLSSYEWRIYADDYANEYAIVDQIDYSFLVQWRWKLHYSRKSKGTKVPKVYLARTVAEIIGPDYLDEQGKRKQCRRSYDLFLHEAVMERKGDQKPRTNKRLIIDHANGKGLDCRRSNLRWTTISFNNKNRFGSHELELDLAL